MRCVTGDGDGDGDGERCLCKFRAVVKNIVDLICIRAEWNVCKNLNHSLAAIRTDFSGASVFAMKIFSEFSSYNRRAMCVCERMFYG